MFKFPPESIGELDMGDLAFWNEGIGKITQWTSMGT